MRRRDVSKQDLVDHSAITPHTHSPLSIRPTRGFDDLAPPCRTEGCLLTRPFGRIFSFGYAYTTLSTFFLTFTHQRDERDSAFGRILPGFLRRGLGSIVLGAHAVILRTRLCCSILASYLSFFPFTGHLRGGLGSIELMALSPPHAAFLASYLSFFPFTGGSWLLSSLLPFLSKSRLVPSLLGFFGILSSCTFSLYHLFVPSLLGFFGILSSCAISCWDYCRIIVGLLSSCTISCGILWDSVGLWGSISCWDYMGLYLLCHLIPTYTRLATSHHLIPTYTRSGRPMGMYLGWDLTPYVSPGARGGLPRSLYRKYPQRGLYRRMIFLRSHGASSRASCSASSRASSRASCRGFGSYYRRMILRRMIFLLFPSGLLTGHPVGGSGRISPGGWVVSRLGDTMIFLLFPSGHLVGGEGSSSDLGFLPLFFPFTGASWRGGIFASIFASSLLRGISSGVA